MTTDTRNSTSSYPIKLQKNEPGPLYRKRSSCIRLSVFILFIITLYPSSLFSLDPKKTITQYGHNIWFRQNGLPANAVYVGIQARDGYMWLGTSAGLYRFDGVNFTLVKTNPKDSKVVETISTLCKSTDSSLWIGTTFSGLRRIKNEDIHRYGGKDGLYTKQIRGLLESKTGKLWIGSSYGLFVYTEGKFISVPINPGFITGLAEDSFGRIWVGTHTGVRIFDDKSIKQVESMTVANGLPNNEISSIFNDRNSNVWIGTCDGLARWRKGSSMKVYKWTDGLADNHITSVCEDKDGNLWFGTYKGISRLADNKWSSMTIIDGLTNNHVLNIFEDYEGSIWVCTLEGLNRFMDVNITPFTVKEGLSSDYISSIAQTKDSSLYFLSNADGNITIFKNGKFVRYNKNVGPAYVARNGSLWIGQTGLLFNIDDGKIKSYDTKSGLPMNWISAITEDDKGLILFIDGVGLQRFEDGRLKPYLLKNGKPYSRLEYVVCMYVQPGGLLWIGSTNGLVRIRDGDSTTFTIANGLAGGWINSIHDDQRGSLWLTSPSDGFTRYQEGKFTSFSIKDGLSVNEFYCALTDNDGDLWLSGPRGITYIRRKDIDDYQEGKIKTLNPQVYATADGMKSDECFGEWQPAGWKTYDGHIWFATKKGAVMINHEAFKKNLLPPPVLIERIIADNEIVPMNQFTSLLPGTGRLEFHYTALSYQVPERIQFKYKLEGYDEDWIKAGTQRVAFYTNLPPRDYRFYVIACNNDGIWNEIGSTFSFKIEKYFYETYWFYSIVFFILIMLIFGIYKFRIWQLLKREEELQTRIQEALTNIKTLSGLIPICSNCKKIRNDRGYWDQLEAYIQRHSEATFSHGICPDCLQELYPDIGKSDMNV